MIEVLIAQTSLYSTWVVVTFLSFLFYSVEGAPKSYPGADGSGFGFLIIIFASLKPIAGVSSVVSQYVVCCSSAVELTVL